MRGKRETPLVLQIDPILLFLSVAHERESEREGDSIYSATDALSFLEPDEATTIRSSTFQLVPVSTPTTSSSPTKYQPWRIAFQVQRQRRTTTISCPNAPVPGCTNHQVGGPRSAPSSLVAAAMNLRTWMTARRAVSRVPTLVPSRTPSRTSRIMEPRQQPSAIETTSHSLRELSPETPSPPSVSSNNMLAIRVAKWSVVAPNNRTHHPGIISRAEWAIKMVASAEQSACMVLQVERRPSSSAKTNTRKRLDYLLDSSFFQIAASFSLFICKSTALCRRMTIVFFLLWPLGGHQVYPLPF